MNERELPAKNHCHFIFIASCLLQNDMMAAESMGLNQLDLKNPNKKVHINHFMIANNHRNVTSKPKITLVYFPSEFYEAITKF